MATWRAKCWLGSSSGYQNLEVQASTLNGAKQQFQRIYSAEQIINLHQVRSSNLNSSSDGDGNASGILLLVGIIAAAWAFMSFTPWILMGLGGSFGTWFGEKLTGQSVDEYNERNDDLGHGKALIVLVLALILGGFGFVKGTEIQKGFDPQSSPPTNVNSTK